MSMDLLSIAGHSTLAGLGKWRLAIHWNPSCSNWLEVEIV
jgi:hypothetical protein